MHRHSSIESGLPLCPPSCSVSSGNQGSNTSVKRTKSFLSASLQYCRTIVSVMESLQHEMQALKDKKWVRSCMHKARPNETTSVCNYAHLHPDAGLARTLGKASSVPPLQYVPHCQATNPVKGQQYQEV